MVGLKRTGAAAAVSFLMVVPTAQGQSGASAPVQDAGLRIVVLSGNDNINIISQGTAVPALVEVRDRNDLPVSGASVLFMLGEGGTATLNAGLSQVSLTTNALGQAAVTVNPLASGAVELSVNAAFGGETATAAIVQTNFATAAEAAAAGAAGGTGGGTAAGGGAAAGSGGGGGLGTGALVGIVGAGAGVAAGVAAAAGGEVSMDRAALVELYNATGGPGWANSTNWGSSAPIGDWYGVATNADGRVTDLVLPSNELRGEIPPSFASLANLVNVVLFENQLTRMPSNLGDLTNLVHLDLNRNQLTGIPATLGGLRKLWYLGLAENQLTRIPSTLGNLTNLVHLDLNRNQLMGIPSALGSLANLVHLDLGENHLTRIPSTLGGLRNLEWLSISENDLEVVPPFLGNLTSLTFLNLERNGLSGEIPPALGELTNMRVLYLHENDLSGSIPEALGRLANLTNLTLFENRLSGSIPAALCKFAGGINPQRGDVYLVCEGSGSEADRAALVELYNATSEDGWVKSANWESSAPIDEWYGVTTDADGRVIELDLSNNGLRGSIPGILGSLVNLTKLTLFGNRLSGSIPATLCQFAGINPQQGDAHLPCEGPVASVGDLAQILVADAEAEENVDDGMDFTVSLDRAAAGMVSVDYVTMDGTARAGADYGATSGTLTFSAGERSKTVEVRVLDDTHDEGEETFTLALSNASGGVVVDGQATGRIRNHDPLPRALLARFGRTAAVHVVEQVEERLQARREPGFDGRLAGHELRSGMTRDLATGRFGGAFWARGRASGLGAPAGAVGAEGGPTSAVGVGNGPIAGGGLLHGGRLGRVTGAGAGRMSLGGGVAGVMGGRSFDGAAPRLLSGSAFALNRATRGGGVLSFWSRGAQSSFVGREGALPLGGDVRTAMFGADYAKGPVVVGLSLANSRGLGSYAGGDAGGVATSVTGLYPWLGYRLTDRVTVWGVTGYGAGKMMLTPGRGPSLESGLSMAMAAGGTRGELIDRGWGGFGLAVKADALWVGTSVDGVDGPSGRLAATEAAVTRFRAALQGSREFVLAGRVLLRPSTEVGVRHDGGDAEKGVGVDVGGGLVLADPSTGLAVDIRARMLVAHQADGFRERGMAVSLSYDPTPSTPLGFTARVAPSWGGQAAGGADALWRRETMAGLADGGLASGNRVDTELGYGLRVGSRFVGIPRVGFAATEYGRDYRMGYGLTLFERETLNFELGVDARRRASLTQGGADNGLVGRVLLGW